MYFLVYFYVYGVSCDVSHPNFFFESENAEWGLGDDERP